MSRLLEKKTKLLEKFWTDVFSSRIIETLKVFEWKFWSFNNFEGSIKLTNQSTSSLCFKLLDVWVVFLHFFKGNFWKHTKLYHFIHFQKLFWWFALYWAAKKKPTMSRKKFAWTPSLKKSQCQTSLKLSSYIFNKSIDTVFQSKFINLWFNQRKAKFYFFVIFQTSLTLFHSVLRNNTCAEK